MPISEDYIKDLMSTKAETYGSESGVTSVKTAVEIDSTLTAAIKAMDGLDPDEPSGSERKASKDENGKLKISYGNCIECGKPLPRPSSTGMCGLKCQLKHNISSITEGVREARTKAEDIKGKVGNIGQSISSLMGSLSEIVSILSKIESLDLDPQYKNWFKVKANTAIQYVKLQVENALISKNQKHLDKLQKQKNGMDASDSGLETVAKAQKAIDAAVSVLGSCQSAFGSMLKAVCSAKPTRLESESLHFAMTPRSMIKRPGQLVNALDNMNTNNSAGAVVLNDKVMEVVSKSFPDIKEAEYLMEPSAFNVRKIMSPYNVAAVSKLTSMLMMLLKGPSEPMPPYENLKLTNLHWLIFLWGSWGPMGMDHYAMPLYKP